MWIVPQWRGIWRRRRQIHEYIWGYFKFHEIPPNRRLWKRNVFFGDSSNRRSTGFNAYWHWVISTSIFRKSWKSVFFLKSGRLNRFQVPRFRTIFGDFFSKIVASSCSWQKIRFQKTEYTWGKFCAEGAIFCACHTTSIAVLEPPS